MDSNNFYLYYNFSYRKYNYIRLYYPSTYFQYRKLKPDIFNTIEENSKINIIRAREITIIVQNKYPNIIYINKNIYNARIYFRRRNLNGYTLTSTLLKVFNNNDIDYIKKIDLNDKIKLLSIIFIFLRYLYIVKRFLKVIIVDNIYNTNRFNYPFYQISNITNINSILNYIFNIINNEK